MGRSRRTLTWDLFLTEAMPECLSEAGVGTDAAAAIVSDVKRRARDYAAGGRASRRALRVPFVDDVASFLPDEAPIGVKANTAVVVRNSLLEDAHADGPLDDGMLTRITYLATGALNQWLSDNQNPDEHAAPTGVFSSVAGYPRAYAALQALALAAESGGRKAFRMPDGKTPSLPSPGAVDPDAPPLAMVRRLGLRDLDEQFLALLATVAAGGADILFTSSLSHYSRDSVVLARVVEFLLAHGASVLTTNFLLRAGETFSRRPPFVAAHSAEPRSVLTADRLSGLHAKYVRQVLDGGTQR